MEIGNAPAKMDLKSKVIITISSAIVYSFFLLIASLILDQNLFYSTAALILILVFAVFFGFVFPDLLANIMHKAIAKNVGKINPELDEGEKTEAEGPASLVRGKTTITGKIFLTSHNAIFYTSQTEETTIPYESIDKLTEGKTAGIVSNRLYIKTKERKTFHFIVNQPDVWIKQISERIKK